MKKLYSKNSATITISLIIILFACKKTNVDNNNIPLQSGTLVTASVAGRVTDENNAPVTGASVAAGTYTAVTDANGRFTFNGIQLDKDAGFVKVTKAGNFTGSRTFIVNPNATNNVKIQMIPKTVSGTIASSSGGNVDVTGGAIINFTASSFANAASNTAYSGQVSVAGFYLNPDDDNFRQYMPGDLRGISIANKDGVLHSFGMLSVEMNDAGGQKLQLATGKTASITIPIPSSMQATAPATTALWYFDETKGLWKEEGTATRQGNTYRGTVTHFSFWSAGQLENAVKLTAKFIDSKGNIQINKSVFMISGSHGITSGTTDNAGTITGYVPANEELSVQVLDDVCGILIYKLKIGPFSTDTNLGNIIVLDYGNLVHITITGTASSANDVPISRGYAVVTSTYNYNQFIAPISNGAFSIPVNICRDLPVAATVWVYDSVNNQSSNEYPITINSTNQNVGQIKTNGIATPPVAPVSGFSYSVGNTTLPVTVTFTNTSINATSWLWNFGDGTSSTAQDPAHSYTTAGDFPVSLKATGAGGSDSILTVIHISGVADDSYINLALNGTTYSWAYPNIDAGHTDSSTVIYGTAPNLIYINILSNNTSPANYNINLSATINGRSYLSNNATTTVTEYGSIGGNIIGTGSGQLADSTTSIPFTLAYKVKRNR